MKILRTTVLSLFIFCCLRAVLLADPVLELERSTDLLMPSTPLPLDAGMLAPQGEILPGAVAGPTVFWRMIDGAPGSPGTPSTITNSGDGAAVPVLELERWNAAGGTWDPVPVDSGMLTALGGVLPGGVSSDRYRLAYRTASLEEFALIPAGTFQMGDALGEGFFDETPVHAVTLSAFFMKRTEVTNDELVEVLNWAYGEGKLSVETVPELSVENAEGDPQGLVDLTSEFCRISWNGSQFVVLPAKGSGYPAVEVTWYGAVAYANYRSQKEGLTPCYDLSDWSCDFSVGGYRLPTEAEWEYAARGGLSGKRFPWGDTISHAEANYVANGSSYTFDVSPYSDDTYHPDWDNGDQPFTSPVGTFAANGYGLHDMAGNVWEWCWDWFSDNYYSVSPATDPTGPATGTFRVDRGGSWDWDADLARVSLRDVFEPQFTSKDVGFRLVRKVLP